MKTKLIASNLFLEMLLLLPIVGIAETNKSMPISVNIPEIKEDCSINHSTRQESCHLFNIAELKPSEDTPSFPFSTNRGVNLKQESPTKVDNDTQPAKIAVYSTGKRVALVIGNGNYQSSRLPQLTNPPNDAEDIAKELRKFGFEVLIGKDLIRSQMNDSIAEFGRKASNADAALFYYAGHGIQIKNQNYIMPVDSSVKSVAQVADQGVNINYILDELDNAKSAVNIVMLDACRDNPFTNEYRGIGGRGLAAPSSMPKGTVIVYATDPGNTAEDGFGRNGLFTAGILAAFKGNDLSLDGVLTTASEKVDELSNHRQMPYVNGPKPVQKHFLFSDSISDQPPIQASLENQVIVENQSQIERIKPQGEGTRSSPASLQTRPLISINPLNVELSFWDSIKNSADPKDFRAYLKKYPNGQFIDLAQNRIHQFETLAESTPKPTTPPPVVNQLKTLNSPTHNNSQVSGSTFRDCSDCPEMVIILGGSFVMGSSPSDSYAQADEKPHHQVQVKRFALGKYEVTRQQFAAFTNETGYSDSEGSSCWTLEEGKTEERRGRGWQNPAFHQDDNHPVVCVNAQDAEAYAEWLSQKTGKVYRLPTEAEWEYAARSNTQTLRYWGDSTSDACAFANVADKTAQQQIKFKSVHNCSDGYVYTAPVGNFRPNTFGLYDMLGNVWEWTCSSYTREGYDGNEIQCLNSANNSRVDRGGSWLGEPSDVRSGARYGDDAFTRSNNLGFRLVQDL